MKAEVRVKKTLVADNNKSFIEGGEIAFTMADNNVTYIGEIVEIHDTHMVLCRVEISSNSANKNVDNIPEKMTVPYWAIKDNTCNYVSVD